MAEEFIGKYRIIEKIGAGGMAKVYLAGHKDVPNLKVVLKILSDSRLIDRFKQEADKMALLDGHSNICQIKHFFDHGEDLVIAMEYIHGQTLEELVKHRGRIPVKEAVEITIDVLSTLEFAHNKKIFHRDIKPGNIMIDENSKIKIIDFGIAKAEDDPDLTMAGSACGTPAYMAPEQFTPSVRTNYALIDVYAVGTMLFYMLTGQLPFKGENQFVLRDAKLFNEPAKPTQFNKDIPKKLERLILKSIDKDYHERHQTANELREDLERFMDESGIGTKEPTYDEITQVDLKSKKKSGGKDPKNAKKTMPALFGSFFVIVIAAVYFVFFMNKDQTPAPDPPLLVSPADGAELNRAQVNFSWEANAGQEGRYEIQVAAGQSFDSLIIRTESLINRFNMSRPFDPGRYFWRVKSIDSSGTAGDFSESRSFAVGESEQPVEPGHLTVTIKPSGDVFIDDGKVASNTGSYNIDLSPGAHEIRVENPNSTEKRQSREISLESGESRNLRFEFTPPPPQVRYGQIRIGTNPPSEADIIIDGEHQPLKTPNTYQVEAGTHNVQVRVELSGQGVTADSTITVKADEIIKLIFDLKK